MNKNNIAVFIAIICALIIAGTSTDCGILLKKDTLQYNDTIPLTKHWETPIPHQKIPEGLTSISAASCGSCHQEIYNEWQQSTHAVAFQDLQFQAEWKKDDILTCLNCHTPLQNQQEFIVKGLINGDYKTPLKEPNPYFDKNLQSESITCATCHVRDGNVIGVLGNTNAPHKTNGDVVFLSEKLCISCHNVVDELNAVLVCTFETGDEWQNNRARKTGITCISCHMPETERPVALGFGKRVSHSHYFAGSGIPKFYGIKVKGLNGLEIKADSLKQEYKAGENLTYSLVLKNSFAAHKVPTGDPERFFLIRFHVQDSCGDVLEAAQFRIGEEWQWYPVAKKLSDNNLKPLEQRVFDFSYQLPEKNGLSLIVEISKHRMTKENAGLMEILDKYPLSISVFKQSYPIHLKNN
jgi:cytochrome c554/c'-like protein